ncbi:MAG: hypothetical protein ACXWZS_09405 [Gemmatirosa sp.]
MLALPIGAVSVGALSWFEPLAPSVRVAAGAAAPNVVRVPIATVNRLLRVTIRFVADLAPTASGTLVWVQGDSELLVDAFGVQMTCEPGLVTVHVPVACDQLPRPASIPVPFAVGTAERTTGLVMATFDRLAGPEIVTARWSEAITAFAWEALVHLAQQLSGAVGKDADGRALVPASVGAENGVLLVQPMGRHDLSTRIAR